MICTGIKDKSVMALLPRHEVRGIQCSCATSPFHVFDALFLSLRSVLGPLSSSYWSYDRALVLTGRGGTLHDEVTAGEGDSFTYVTVKALALFLVIRLHTGRTV
jgi:hypothetical protein